MDYKLQITDRAVELLGRIIDYLVSRLKNPTAARKLLTEIEAIYSHLESEESFIADNSHLSSSLYIKYAFYSAILLKWVLPASPSRTRGWPTS